VRPTILEREETLSFLEDTSMRPLSLASALLLALSIVAVAPTDVAAATDEESPNTRFLKRAGLATEDADLLRIVKNAAGEAADRDQIDSLVKQFGDADFDKREKASQRVVTVGAAALPRLRAALKDSDVEVVKRAKECIEAIEKTKHEPPVAQAAARLLIRRRAEGTGQALLDYLPAIVGDPALSDEILFALDGLAERDAKTRAALAAALKDASPVRRAGAACILARRGDKADKAAVKALLEDKEPLVRLRAAQGMLAALDKGPLPVLIALLDSPEIEIAWQAEELLHWAAGENAPEAVLGAGQATDAKACREAWEAWVRGKCANVDLAAAAAERRPGLMLLSVSDLGANPGIGRVYVCGSDGNPRWQLKELKNLTDVRILPGGRVVLAGWEGASERNLSGEIRWQLPGRWESCEVLSNGNYVLMSMNKQFTELAEDGRKIREQMHQVGGRIPRIRADGLLVAIRDTYVGDRAGELIEVDPANGKIVNTFKVPETGQYTNSQVEPLSDGHVLVCGRMMHRVFELNNSGQMVWQATLDEPLDASRRPDGGTLVACGLRVVELDSAGRVVVEIFPAGSVRRVRAYLGAVRLGFPDPKPEAVDAELNRARSRALRSKDAPVRLKMVQFIGRIGPKAWGTVPALAELLSDSDMDVRLWTLVALESIGPPAKEAIPALLRAMDGGDQPTWERHAPDALASIGAPAIPPLIKAIKEDKSATVRAGAAHALGTLANENPDCMEALIGALKDEDPLVRRHAAWGLQAIRPAPKEVVGALVEAMEDKDEKVRDEAAGWLGIQADKRPWGGKADVAPFVPQLLKAIESGKGKTSAYALRALGTVGPKDPKVLPVLVERLKDSDDLMAQEAVEGLLQFGPEAHPAAAALAEFLKTKGPPDKTTGGTAQERVCQVLAIIGPKAAKDALPVLTEMVRDKKSQDLRFRGELALALGAMGPAAKDMVPLLADELKSVADNRDGHPDAVYYRNCLIQGLLGIGDDGATVVLDLTSAKPEAVLDPALWMLQFNPSAAKAAVPGLSALLKRGSSRQGCAAALALAEIGPNAKQAGPALRDALKTMDPAQRVRAAQALARIDPDARTLVPILRDCLGNGPKDTPSAGHPPNFVAASAWALGEIGPDAGPAVPALMDHLKRTAHSIRPNMPGSLRLQDVTLEKRTWMPIALHEVSEDDRACVLLALGRIGPNAQEAVPALLEVLGDANEQSAYRCLAAEALGLIGPSAKSTVPALTRIVKDQENTDFLQAYAAEALGKIGPDAKDVLPILKETTTEGRIVVRRAAAKAIKGIAP
jgi:HEAT repeat protein